MFIRLVGDLIYQPGPRFRPPPWSDFCRARSISLSKSSPRSVLFPSTGRLGEVVGRRFQPSGDENRLPETGICSCGGNLNASEETIDRKKKFPTFAPKLVQITATIGQFSADFDIVAQSFWFCERMFGLIQITG
jgi:hypothetical protein